ncbi:hypothetical protein KR009_000499 [Drosophila setifemur]|nr:hypothetical protein KR009_000499 [Drosophila setifemur]
MEAGRILTDLPLEILDRIFECLGTRSDKLNLAQAHPILADVFALHSCGEYRELKAWNFMTDESWSFLLHYCGMNVKSLSLKRPWNNVLGDLVAYNCPNLEELSCYVSDKTSQSVKSFLLRFKNQLKSVELHVELDAHPKIIDALAEAPNLRKFYISQFNGNDVYEIQNLLQLEELTIQIRLHPVPVQIDILKICAPLKNLRCLVLFNVQFPEVEGASSVTWPSLVELKLSGCYLSHGFPFCPELKALQIRKHYLHTGNVRNIVLRSAQTLESLWLACSGRVFNDDQFLDFLRISKNLRYCKNRFINTAIYSENLRTMVNILRNNGVTAEKPFVLIMESEYEMRYFDRNVSTTN